MTREQIEQQARKEAEEVFPTNIQGHLRRLGRSEKEVQEEVSKQEGLRAAYLAALLRERSKPSLFDRMEAVCRRRYRDGDTVYFRTLGMSDENTGQFLVRINRKFLHRASSLKDAIEAAVKEFEESDDPNDQLEPLPTSHQ